MKVFKKLSFLLVGLPLFFGLLVLFSQQTSAQTTFNCNNGARLNSTGIKQVNSTNTIYTIKLENRANTQCTYTLSASPTTGWTYAFLQENSNTLEYVGGRITVSGNSPKNFKIKATPASSINAGTYTLRVKVAPSTQGEYEDITYTKQSICNKGATLTTSNKSGSGDNKSRIYDLKLVNNNPTGCPPVKYSLSTVTPNNSTWKVNYLTSTGTNLGITSITRSSGQPLNFKIKVSPPSGATGDKLIKVSATDSSRVTSSRELSYKFISNGSGGDGGGTNAECVELAPKIEITPLNRNGIKGSEKQYEVKVTNIDEEKSCPNSVKVTLKRDLPGDQNTSWTGRFENNELNVPRGESRKTTLFIKSPKTATLGEKSIFVKASRPANSKQITRSKTIKYTVIAGSNENPDNQQPNACVRKTPLLTVDPESKSSQAGREVSYEVKVKNIDEGSCSDRKLTLQRALPNTNWTGSWSSSVADFNIAKNVEKKFTLKVKSPTNATNGNKDIVINLKNNSNQAVGSKTIKYVVESNSQPTTCVRKNPVLTVDPESINSLPGREVSYEVKVTNADEGPCADRTLTIQRTLPSAQWTGTWSADNTDFNIAKNAEKKFTLKLKSPNNASVGTKNITITVKNSNDQTVGTKNITYIVGTETTTPPPPSDAARLNFVLGIDGIGTTPRVPLGGNKNPNDQFRQLNFKIYSAADNTLKYEVVNFPFTYNSDSQKFQTVYDFPAEADVPDGTYNIYVEGSPFLVTQYPGSVTIKKGEVTNLTSPNFYMITGNINNSDQSQNKIDILDYNVLISCSIFAKSTELCDSNENYSKWSDLNNNGVVDQDDYTLWLREFANQQGAQLPN